MIRMLKAQSTSFKNMVYNCIFNKQCVYCLIATDEAICPDCLECFPLLGTQCPSCAEPNDHGEICGHCLKQAPSFSGVICPYIYKGPIKKLLQSWKQSGPYSPYTAGLKQVMHTLWDLLAEKEFDLIIPVPYHWRRLLKRGHQPTGQLSRFLSHQMNTPVCQGLKRIKGTTSQRQLKRTERFKNLKSAFALKPKYKAQLKGKNVLLVDDVMTTGATVESASRVLIQAGAKSVTIACLARTPTPA